MPEPPRRQRLGRRPASAIGAEWGCALAAVAAAAIYIRFAATFFPAPPGHLGEDYSYFMPALLAGKYWIARNGLFAVPHFTPAFCGGLPFLANPRAIFYSVPQLLAEFVDPQTSFFATEMAFVALGAFGTFLLLRRRFAASVPAASLAAVIFQFNGFLLYRMAIGHVTYHAFGLFPLLCHVLLTPITGRRNPLRRLAGMSALGGAMLAYFVYAGAVDLVVPLAFSALAVALLHALVRRPSGSFFLVGAAAGLLAALVAAAQLAPAIAWIHNFPRTAPLRIFPDFVTALGWLIRALFLPWAIPDFLFRQELEYGVGAVPLLLLVAGGCLAVARGALRRRYGSGRWAAAVALIAVLFLPLWLNSGGPEFAAWLKTLPYFGENVILVRWFVVYVLPATVAAALCLDALFAGAGARAAAALVGIVATIVPAVFADTAHYRDPPYDPAGILAADRALSRTGAPPPITGIAEGHGEEFNDGLAQGQSAFPCYEPIFGYRLQSFPWGILRGPLSLPGHHLRNPACYIYGRANGCAPGDGFTAAAAGAEAAFAAYRPFPFTEPWWQEAADIASFAGLGLLLAGMALGASALPARLTRGRN